MFNTEQYLPPDLIYVVAISTSRSHTCCGNIYLRISYMWQYLTPDLMHIVAISTSRSHARCGNIYPQISCMLWQYLPPDLMHLVAYLLYIRIFIPTILIKISQMFELH